jgi:hypothetical protein
MKIWVIVALLVVAIAMIPSHVKADSANAAVVIN